MPSHGSANGHRGSETLQLAVVAEHLERIKDVAISLGETRGIWTASAADALASYLQEQTDAALIALERAKP
jgi:hypothetical protein